MTSPSTVVQIDTTEAPLSAPLTLSFDYTRSLGPVLGAFCTALRERRVVGVRGTDGRVHVPPVEYDPVSCAELSEMVPVAAVGTVISWSWQPAPLPGQPLTRAFAWALIRLDGADTPLLHAVDVPEGGIAVGDRVRVRWAEQTVGAITDIACFEPCPDPESGTGYGAGSETGDPRDRPAGATSLESTGDPVTMLVCPTSATIDHSASREESAYLRALQQGRLLGNRTAADDGSRGPVFFPPRGADPATGSPATEFVELADTGTVTTFAIINIPFAGQRIQPPYVAAYIVLDGADIPFLHLVTDIDADQVRMGMRVKAVWKPAEQWGLGIDNIDYFAPTGEPDADYDTYKHHL